MGDHDPPGHHVVVAFQPPPDIVQHGLFHVAPVLAPHGHGSVAAHHDLGPQLQQVRPQSRHAGAAAALVEIFQGLQHEAHVQTGAHLLQLIGNIPGLHALGSHLRGCHGQLAAAGGEIQAVHREHIVHPLGGDAGILIAGRELIGDIDMDDVVTLARPAAEAVLVGPHGNGAGLGQGAGLLCVVVQLPGGHIHPVVADPVPQGHFQRQHLQVEALVELRRQVAGGIAGDLDFSHEKSPSHPSGQCE